MDKPTRNTLRNAVTRCRRLLEESIGEVLQGQYGIHANGQIEDAARMTHLSAEERQYREQIVIHVQHIQAGGFKPKDAAAQLVREVAFTHLNRLVAYKLMETRGLIREAVSRGLKSQGFIFYLADQPEDEQLWSGGKQDVAYRHFLLWLGASFADEIPALFSPHDSANRLFPPQRVLDEVLDLLNSADLTGIWGEDETIGWVYQYFTPKELRDQARKESAAPRNSYELAFRNQFYTPRYVVEFLTDNTLGRIWYEMRQGDTALRERCRYLVIRPDEDGETEGQRDGEMEGQGDGETEGRRDGETERQRDAVSEITPSLGLSIPLALCPSVSPSRRPPKDPRDILMLDPAGGSGHFGLYCFDLFETIYAEAYDDADLGPRLQKDYPDRTAYLRDVPRLILAHNLHIIDIDPRACQIAALALWLRAQRAYQAMGLRPADRPKITRSNIVCAEPMPGEQELLDEFIAGLQPKFLGQMVQVVFDKMKLAGEAGSLLKIEDEISEAVAAAKKQWLAEPQPEQLSLFPEEKQAKPGQLTLFDLSGITDEEFWNEAETRVLEALRDYAEHATRGQLLRRQLFADDAAQGFNFIDVCRKRFDAVLMNPPFGAASSESRDYIRNEYPITRNDLYTAFTERGINLLTLDGRMGAITSRTGLFLPSFEAWRTEYLLGKTRLAVVADLGFNVLDTATVETAAYVIANTINQVESVFFRCIEDDEKGDRLLHAASTLESEVVYVVPIYVFTKVPKKALAYWVKPAMRTVFERFPQLETNSGQVRIGLASTNDPRFVRLAWEVPPAEIDRGKRWAWYAKGGKFARYYQDIHLLVNWHKDGDEIRQAAIAKGDSPSRYIENEALYFLPGLTFPRTTIKGFNVRLMPANCIFGNKGPAIFPIVNSFYLLGILNSSIAEQLLLMMTTSRSWENSIVKALPVPIDASHSQEIVQLVTRILGVLRTTDTATETSRLFTALDRNDLSTSTYAEKGEIANFQATIDSLALTQYQISSSDLESVSSVLNVLTPSEASDDSEQDEEDSQVEDVGSREQLSYAFGCAVGRWDVRVALNPALAPRLQEPFEPLPVCPPGALVNPAGLPATSGHIVSEEWLRARPNAITLPPDGSVQRPTIADDEYPLRVDWDGILVDDADHPDDIVRRVRDVLDVLWPHRSEAIEREACDILEVKDLRDYFRKPGQGGFWLDHVKRYSKSRRKAPIYWLLQSSRKNYALWLYYHRLDKDLLYKALVNYVEPKIRLEDSRLTQMRAQKLSLGTGGREVKQLEKQIERQAAFVLELQDFHDKLRRAADLHLEPDLNDGVVLNIAPLWELVPWKEAQAYWAELLAGKYEWSSIGKQLKAKGYIK